MPISPVLDQKTNLVSYKVTINGTPLREDIEVVTILVEKNLNKLPYAKFEILDGDPAKQDQEVLDEFNWTPGMDIQIEVGYNQKLEVIFKGIISGIGHKSQYEHHALTQIECTDKCVALTNTRDNQTFLEKKDSDIVTQLVRTYSGIECTATSTNTTHPNIVQYNASDWDFILSRAKNCERVVIADSNKLEFVKAGIGSKEVKLTFGQDIIDLDLDIDAKNQRKEIETKAWDAGSHEFKTASSTEPSSVDKQGSSDVKGTKLADGMQFKKETLMLPSTMQSDELKDIANSKLLHSRLSRVRGSIKIQGFAKLAINSYLDLEKTHPHYGGEVFVSGVKHTVEQGNFMTEAIIGLDISSFEGETTTGSTPNNMGLMPGPSGLYNGVVLAIDGDPEGNFRVKIKIPSISEEGVWAQQTNTYAGKDGGFIWYPEVDDQVIVGFIMNDPRYPVILGSRYSKKFSVFNEHQPASDNNQKAIVTRTHMKILFEEDKKDITITTPGKNFIKISDQDQKIHLEDQHGNKIVMDSNGILIKSPKKITVEAGQQIDMDAVSSFTAKGSSIELKGKSTSATLEGASSVTVKGGASAKLSANGMTTISGTPIKLN